MMEAKQQAFPARLGRQIYIAAIVLPGVALGLAIGPIRDGASPAILAVFTAFCVALVMAILPRSYLVNERGIFQRSMFAKTGTLIEIAAIVEISKPSDLDGLAVHIEKMMASDPDGPDDLDDDSLRYRESFLVFPRDEHGFMLAIAARDSCLTFEDDSRLVRRSTKQ